MKAYAKLRGRMAELEVTGEALSLYLGKSKVFVSNRFNNRQSWDIDDVYKILDYLELPLSEIYTYFPPNGGVDVKKSRTRRN